MTPAAVGALDRLVARAEHQTGLCRRGLEFAGIAERLLRALSCVHDA